MTTITTTLPGYTSDPVRGTSSFNTDVQTRMNEMAANATAFNTACGEINTVAGEVNTNATNAASSASSASSSASSAAADAAIAASHADSIIATSTSSQSIGTGTKTFTIQSGKQFAAGQFVSIVSDADSSNYMHGAVTSYSGTTLIVNILDVGGSGTYADWGIGISGTQGPKGDTGSVSSHGNELHDETFVAVDDYATSSTGGTVKVRLNGTTAYFTTNGNNA